MLGQYTLANNVRTTLNTAINTVVTTLVLDPAVGEYNNFPNPSGDTASNGKGIATLADSLYNPTQTEIITYTGISFGAGVWTMTGVVRGVEGTTARSYAAGAVVFQALTAGQQGNPLITVNQTTPGVGLLAPTTVTGAVVQQDAAASGFMTSIAGGVIALMRYASGFKNRMLLTLAGTEFGSNAGSDLKLSTLADDGTTVTNSQAISVNRSTGNVGVSAAPDATAKLNVGGQIKATSAAIAGAFSVTGALTFPGTTSQLVRGDGALATLGTAAAVNTGTSSGTIPLCNGAITWSGATQSYIATNISMSWATTSFPSNALSVSIADATGLVSWKMASTAFMTVSTVGTISLPLAASVAGTFTTNGALNANGIINAQSFINVNGLGSFTAGLHVNSAPLVADAIQFNNENSLGTATTSKTVNWDLSSNQVVTLTSATACTFTFTAPSFPAWLTMRVKAAASGTAAAITFPATVKFSGGTAPATPPLTKVNVYRFYWDGTNYWGDAIANA